MPGNGRSRIHAGQHWKSCTIGSWGSRRTACQSWSSARPAAAVWRPARTAAQAVVQAQSACPAAAPAGAQAERPPLPPPAPAHPWAVPAPGHAAAGLGWEAVMAAAAGGQVAAGAAATAAVTVRRRVAGGRAAVRIRGPAAGPAGKPPALAGPAGRGGRALPAACSCGPTPRPPAAPVWPSAGAGAPPASSAATAGGEGRAVGWADWVARAGRAVDCGRWWGGGMKGGLTMRRERTRIVHRRQGAAGGIPGWEADAANALHGARCCRPSAKRQPWELGAACRKAAPLTQGACTLPGTAEVTWEGVEQAGVAGADAAAVAAAWLHCGKGWAAACLVSPPADTG